MQPNDDIAFQRAILANPADTTLKLIYADWLQERDDPRAEFVRAQLEGRPLPEGEFDPAWVAFMTTLAQPFEPIPFAYSEAEYPFKELISRRGSVAAFEPQYRGANDWSEGLLVDLAFLTSMDWGQAGRDYGGYSALSFLCDLPANATPRTADEIRDCLLLTPALDVPDLLPEEIVISPSEGILDSHGTDWVGRLRRHVTDGYRYNATRHLARSSGVEARPAFVGFTVGKSLHGNRFVGGFWRRWS